MVASSWSSRRPIGESARVVVGTMSFGAGTPEAEAARIVARALERGATAFDTANLYAGGESERILGRALRGRGEAHVATKVGIGRMGGPPEGLSRRQILASVDESLARLGLDAVELLYLHMPDRATPPEETLDAIALLLDGGRIRSWGVSNYASWRALELIQVARARSLPPPVASEVLYNALVRQIEIEHLDFAARYGVHVSVYNPLAGGLLSDRYSTSAPPPPGSRLAANPVYRRRYAGERMRLAAAAIAAIAVEAGLSRAALAYRWVAGRPGIDSVIAGPGTVAHLDEALDSVAAPLPPDVAARVDGLLDALDGTDARYAR